MLLVPLRLLRNIDLMLRRPDPEEGDGQGIVIDIWRAARFLDIRLIQLDCLNFFFQAWWQCTVDQIAAHGPLWTWEEEDDLHEV